MSAPIAMLVPAIADPVAPPAGPAPGQPTFEMALGAAVLASAPPPVAVPLEPAPPLLTLLLEGEWTLEPAVDGDDAATTTEAPANGEDAEAPLIPLEKGLADWFAKCGRQDHRLSLEGTDGDHAVDDESLALDSDGADPILPAEVEPAAARFEPSVRSIEPYLEVASSVAGLTVRHEPIPTDPVGDETATTDLPAPLVSSTAAPGPFAAGSRSPGRPSADQGFDPATLLALRTMHEPIVEIGGFAFPVEPDTVLTPAPAPPAGAVDGAESLLDPMAPPAAGASSFAAAVIRDAADRLNGGAANEESPVRPGRFAPVESIEAARVVAVSTRGEDGRAGADSQRPGPGLELPKRRTADGADVQAPATAPIRIEPSVDDGSPPADVRPAAVTTAESEQRIARRVDSLMLDLRDEQGDYGRLRVSVSGPTVRATILPNDPGLADRLNVGIRELRQALEERGFTDSRLNVQQPKTTDAPVWMPTGREPVLDPTLVEQRGLPKQTTEGERRDRWADARQDRQEHGRQSRQGRDPRQDQRGNR